MRKSLLIMSAAYCGQELCSTFGKLPPCFLPLGNRRLYELQLEFGRKHYDQVVLSLPDDFAISSIDADRIAAFGAMVHRSPPSLSLGEAIQSAAEGVILTDELDILYGDTLLPDLAPRNDVIAVGHSKHAYNWEVDQDNGGSDFPVWAGFFAFSDFSRILTHVSNGVPFLYAVQLYDQTIGLERDLQRSWLDFGHVNTYYTSKLALSSARHFNSLVVEGGVVEKRSKDARKMQAEANWFETLPPRVRIFTPAYLGRLSETDGNTGYALEYMPMPSLSELFVFGRLPGEMWGEIFNLCWDFLNALKDTTPKQTWEKADSEQLYVSKTERRLTEASEQMGFTMNSTWKYAGRPLPPLRQIFEDCAKLAVERPAMPGVIHGDFCFSNVLYDSRANRIRVIDPRGLSENGEITTRGDVNYEFAKLAHSVLGLYDFLVSDQIRATLVDGTFNIDFPLHQVADAQHAFQESKFRGVPMKAQSVEPLVVLLFLSMLPLHADKPSRQWSFLANALRIYENMQR